MHPIRFHIGSGCTRPDFYVKNIELAKQVFDIASEEGIEMNILDIGGGFSGRKETESAFLQVTCYEPIMIIRKIDYRNQKWCLSYPFLIKPKP